MTGLEQSIEQFVGAIEFVVTYGIGIGVSIGVLFVAYKAFSSGR